MRHLLQINQLFCVQDSTILCSASRAVPGESQASVPTVKPIRQAQFGTTGQPVVIGTVTPGSLADQYNRAADGSDPISFFYPDGYLY